MVVAVVAMVRWMELCRGSWDAQRGDEDNDCRKANHGLLKRFSHSHAIHRLIRLTVSFHSDEGVSDPFTMLSKEASIPSSLSRWRKMISLWPRSVTSTGTLYKLGQKNDIGSEFSSIRSRAVLAIVIVVLASSELISCSAPAQEDTSAHPHDGVTAPSIEGTGKDGRMKSEDEKVIFGSPNTIFRPPPLPPSMPREWKDGSMKNEEEKVIFGSPNTIFRPPPLLPSMPREWKDGSMKNEEEKVIFGSPNTIFRPPPLPPSMPRARKDERMKNQEEKIIFGSPNTIFRSPPLPPSMPRIGKDGRMKNQEEKVIFGSPNTIFRPPPLPPSMPRAGKDGSMKNQ
ncbi:hypothetical protein EJB05_08688, partial [Eragrostis curvula]